MFVGLAPRWLRSSPVTESGTSANFRSLCTPLGRLRSAGLASIVDRHGLAGRRYGPGPPRDLEGVGGVHGEALWSRTCARLSINAGGQETSLLNLPSHSTSS